MKKKILGILVFLVAMFGVMYFMGVFSPEPPTQTDLDELEKSKVEMEKVLEDAENIKMPGSEEDTIELDLGLDDEDFDPESML